MVARMLSGSAWRFVVVALTLMLPLRAVEAHPRILRAVPAADSHDSRAPRDLTVQFDEPLSVALCRLALIDDGGRPVRLDSLRIAPSDAKSLTARILGTIVAGRYTVRWQAAGADGHPVRGEYTFTVDASAEPPPVVDQPPIVETSQPNMTFGVSSPAYVIIRAIQSIALVCLIGLLALNLVVLPRFGWQAADEWPAVEVSAEGVSTGGAAVALWMFGAATLTRLVAQHAAVFGTTEPWSLASVSALTLQSAWGGAWWLAIVGTSIGLWATRRIRRTLAFGWTALVVATSAMILSVSMSGHAAVATSPAFAVTVHAMHILGAGGWIGSLSALVLIGIPAALRLPADVRHTAVAALVRAFSPTALAFAGLLMITGVIAGWRNLGTLNALWTEPYGQILLAKLSMLSVAAAAGAYNWKRVLPLLGTATATSRLRRSASVELTAALIVLLITAVLVATPMPGDLASGM